MKEAFLLLMLAITTAPAQSLVQEWVRRHTSSCNGDDAAVGIAVDGEANVYVAGYSSGPNGYLTIKYSGAGLPLWTNRYDGPGHNDRTTGIALDPGGNVFVTGASYGENSGPDYATVAYSNVGMALWTNRYSGPGNTADEAQAIAVDASGDVYVIGYSGTGSSYNYATIKYSNAGVPLWTNLFAGPDNYPSANSAIALDVNGNVLVTGASIGGNGYLDYATIRYSSAGVALWTNYYNGPGDYADKPVGVASDSKGNVFVTGVSYGNGTGFDFATIAYSAAGTPLWTNRYDGPGNDWDYAKTIAVNDTGEVFVTGDSPRLLGAAPNYATVAYSGAGIPLWTNRYAGGIGDDEAAAMALDDSGNIYVAGYSVGNGTSSDYATIKYSSTGVPLCTNRYDGPFNSADGATAIAVDRDGNLFVAGSSIGIGSGVDFATIKYSIIRPIPLGIQKVDDQVVLTWTNSALGLQSAPAISGVFTNIPDATSPHTHSVIGAQQFFRLISN